MAAILPYLEEEPALEAAEEDASPLAGAEVTAWPSPPADMKNHGQLKALGWSLSWSYYPLPVGAVFSRVPAIGVRLRQQDALQKEPKYWWVAVTEGVVDDNDNSVRFYARNLVTGKKAKVTVTSVGALTHDQPVWIPPAGLYPDDETSSLGDLGEPRAKSWAEQDRNPIRAHVEANHANLTRFVWARRLVEDHLTKAQYWIERDRKKGFVFKIAPGLPNDIVPWKLMGTAGKAKAAALAQGLSPTRDTFPLIGEGNGKMECPAWDLPAGATSLGGSCPGSPAGQTAVPIDIRRHHLTPDGKFLRAIPPGATEHVPFREAATICSACYAGEGNFGYSEQLAGNALRLAWTRDMIRTPEGLREWVEIMAEAIVALRADIAVDDFSHEQIRPFRVHSSGDFFSPAYAKAWMHLANRVYEIDPSIRFWCPTRTWAAPRGASGSAFDWTEILSNLKYPNLVVRPSAFHVGDPAPGRLADHPAAARGSTALIGPWQDENGAPIRYMVKDKKTGLLKEKVSEPGVFHIAFPDAISAGENDPRADHNCPVYALKKADEVGSCGAARCRVCWNRPDVSVNYALH